MNEQTVSQAEKEKLILLLKKQLKGFRCLVCGRDQFVILDELQDGLQSNLMLYRGGNPKAVRHAPALTVACTHCGRIEQFAEHPLQQRLNELDVDG